MREINDALAEVFGDHREQLYEVFGIDSGEARLRDSFSGVVWHAFDNDLIVDDPAPVVDYGLSFPPGETATAQPTSPPSPQPCNDASSTDPLRMSSPNRGVHQPTTATSNMTKQRYVASHVLMPSDDLDSRGSRPSVSSGSVESSPKRWKLGDITPSRPCSHRATQSAVPCASDGVVDGRYGRSFGIEERHFYDTQASRSVNIRSHVVRTASTFVWVSPYQRSAPHTRQDETERLRTRPFSDDRTGPPPSATQSEPTRCRQDAE